jgi:hypothetical protein
VLIFFCESIKAVEANSVGDKRLISQKKLGNEAFNAGKVLKP